MSSNESRMWCYQCEAAVMCVVSPDVAPACPECTSTFLEELGDSAAPEEYRREYETDQGDSDDDEPATNAIPLLQLLAAVVQMRNRSDDTEVQASGQLDTLLRAILHGSGSTFGLHSNPQDYVFGGEDAIEQLLHRLFQGQNGDTGPPPATEEMLEAIPVKPMSQSDAGEHCPVCKEVIEVDAPIRQLPCTHFFCEGCIGPWLELHATCPVCRFSLADNSESPPGTDG